MSSDLIVEEESGVEGAAILDMAGFLVLRMDRMNDHLSDPYRRVIIRF